MSSLQKVIAELGVHAEIVALQDEHMMLAGSFPKVFLAMLRRSQPACLAHAERFLCSPKQLIVHQRSLLGIMRAFGFEPSKQAVENVNREPRGVDAAMPLLDPVTIAKEAIRTQRPDVLLHCPIDAWSTLTHETDVRTLLAFMRAQLSDADLMHLCTDWRWLDNSTIAALALTMMLNWQKHGTFESLSS
jgi:hypothetical protein